MEIPQKLNIVLDIDQTIVSAYRTSNLFPNFENEVKELKKYLSTIIMGPYTVFVRPHFKKFIHYLFKNFNVSVWTAGSEDYANVIAKYMMDVARSPEFGGFIFHAAMCRESKAKYGNIKDMRLIWNDYKLENFTPRNTILIDDSVPNCEKQPCVCLNISAFYALEDPFSPTDVELLYLINRLKQYKKNIEKLKNLADCPTDFIPRSL